MQLRVVRRLQSQSLAQAWASWRHHAARMRSCRVLLLRVRCRGLLQALNAWRAHSAQMAQARQLLARVLGGTLRTFFDIWRWVAGAKACLETVPPPQQARQACCLSAAGSAFLGNVLVA